MKHIYLLLFLLSCLARMPAHAQEHTYPEYDTASPELRDIQRLVANTLPGIETMLARHGTFMPFAAVVLDNGDEGEIHVTSGIRLDYTVDDLKEQLTIDALKGKYRLIVLFYVSQVPDPATGKEVTAVGVFAEHSNDDFAYQFYYPYKIDLRKKVAFGASFGDFAEQVMFRL